MRVLIVLVIAAALGWLWWSGSRNKPAAAQPEAMAAVQAGGEAARVVLVGQWRSGTNHNYQIRDNGSFVATRRREVRSGDVLVNVSYSYRGTWSQSGQHVTMNPGKMENVTVLQARAAPDAMFADNAKADSAVNKVRKELPIEMMQGSGEPAVIQILAVDEGWLKVNIDGEALTLQRAN